MRKEDCFYLGRVVKKHGYKGDLKLRFDVDYPEEYQELESVLVETKTGLVPFFFEAYSMEDKGFVRVHLEGVDSEQDAERLVGSDLWLPLALLPDLEGTDFYYHEIVGFEVIDSQYGSVGIIRDVREGNAQDLLVIDHSGTEVLIPVLDELIREVDREAKTLRVDAPEGLIALYVGPSEDEDEDRDLD